MCGDDVLAPAMHSFPAMSLSIILGSNAVFGVPGVDRRRRGVDEALEHGLLSDRIVVWHDNSHQQLCFVVLIVWSSLRYNSRKFTALLFFASHIRRLATGGRGVVRKYNGSENLRRFGVSVGQVVHRHASDELHWLPIAGPDW